MVGGQQGKRGSERNAGGYVIDPFSVYCRGAIEARYKLLPNESVFGSRFSFEPDGGTIGVGGTQTIKVRLMSDILGSFDETFNWAIRGTSDPIALHFRGQVVGPSYEVHVQAVAQAPM